MSTDLKLESTQKTTYSGSSKGEAHMDAWLRTVTAALAQLPCLQQLAHSTLYSNVP